MNWDVPIAKFYLLTESLGMDEYMQSLEEYHASLGNVTDFAYAGLCLGSGFPGAFSFGIEFLPLFLNQYAQGIDDDGGD